MTSSPDAPLTLTTLGGANLAAPNDIHLTPGKPLALLTYLALRQTLWQPRQLLGDTIVTGREELRLGAAVTSDRDRFLAAIESGDPEAAIALYRGDFLPDFALPGSTEFEHWADVERSRRRAAFLRSAEMVARRRLAAGRFREAQEIARRMRAADRLNETGWRRPPCPPSGSTCRSTPRWRRSRSDRSSTSSTWDVIIAKREWATLGESARQLDEVAALLRMRWAELDLPYLERWIAPLGLEQAWAAARGKAGVAG